jgi:hypothetical protein
VMTAQHDLANLVGDLIDIDALGGDAIAAAAISRYAPWSREAPTTGWATGSTWWTSIPLTTR